MHARVVAACRRPEEATELAQLQETSCGRLEIVQLDCTDEESIARAASQVSATNKHLDLLLNVAGILHTPGKMSPGEATLRTKSFSSTSSALIVRHGAVLQVGS